MQDKKNNSVEAVKKATGEAIQNMDDMEQVEEVAGIQGKEVFASHVGKKYFMRPCSLMDIPKLVKTVKQLEDIFKKSAKENKNEYDMLMEQEEGKKGMLDVMAEIILFGLLVDNPDMTTDMIKKEFSLGDFPKAYRIALELNDFLAGMREVMKLTKKSVKLLSVTVRIIIQI